MTLSSTTNKIQYSGDGATVSFAVTFVFWSLDDLRVIHRSAAGVETVWARGTQYTLTGGSGSTGTLTVSTAPTDYTPASGTTLTIKSNLSNTQPTDLPVGGAFPSSTVEQRLDQIVRLIQQRSEEVGRSLKFPESDSSSLTSDIPNSSDRASKYLAFDTSGNPTASSVAVGSAVVTAFAETLLDDTTAAAARTTLGVAYASTTEILTGTESAKVATPDAIAALWEQGSDIASAGTISVGEGGYFTVTGTTTITDIDFATDKAGRPAWLKFAGALTLTHNASTLILPGGANITTAAGDTACFFSEGSDAVRCVAYTVAADAVSGVAAATQAQMEAASSTTVYASPGRTNFHPGVAKAWVKFNTSGTVAASLNIASITDTGAGLWTVNIATDFSTADYCGVAFGGMNSSTVSLIYNINAAAAAGTFAIEANTVGEVTADPGVPTEIYALFFGDQA